MNIYNNKIYIGISGTTNDKNNLGVFSRKFIQKGETIEIAPFIELDCNHSNLPDPLENYVFSSHINPEKTIIVFGYGSMYNHSKNNNVEYYIYDDHKRFIKFVSLYDIEKNQELFINYGKFHSINYYTK